MNGELSRRRILPVAVASLLTCLWVASAPAEQNGQRGSPWTRHTIDGSSRGADGVRLCDAGGDGLADVTTGWEEGGITRVYLHPAPAQVSKPWPAVTVGRTSNVEDAVFVDLDVMTCEEREPIGGGRQGLGVFWYENPTASR